MAENEAMVERRHYPCEASITNREQMIILKESDKELWSAVNVLRNRLPVWATIVISLLTFLLGTAVGALYFALSTIPKLVGG